MRPGVDGVVLEGAGHRGTFLPAVWAKLPDPATFVGHLVEKAGLPAWPAGARAWRYTVDEFADAPGPASAAPPFGSGAAGWARRRRAGSRRPGGHRHRAAQA